MKLNKLKQLITKWRWTSLYSHIPKEIRGKILLRTANFDRVGPITLPLSVEGGKNISDFTIYYFGIYESKQNYFLLTRNSELEFKNPVVRISSNCIWAFAFDSQRCDCNWEFEFSKNQLCNLENNDGLIIFAEGHHGKSITGGVRGHSLIYAAGQHQNEDLVNGAYIKNGFKIDYRNYDDIITILKFLRIDKLKLLTNNPERTSILRENGFEVLQVPIEKPYTQFDSEELGVKKIILKHKLNLMDFKEDDIKIYGLDSEKVFKQKNKE